MFGIIKTNFIGLLTVLVSASNDAKYVSLNNQKMLDSTYLIYILMSTVKNVTAIHL